MTYKIDGVDMPQPTTGKWRNVKKVGISGQGRNLYAPKREFELKWVLLPISDFSTIRGYWLADSATGTVNIDLPDVEASSYAFRTFSGCHVDEPTIGAYFQEHVENVVLIVRNIAT